MAELVVPAQCLGLGKTEIKLPAEQHLHKSSNSNPYQNEI